MKLELISSPKAANLIVRITYRDWRFRLVTEYWHSDNMCNVMDPNWGWSRHGAYASQYKSFRLNLFAWGVFGKLLETAK